MKKTAFDLCACGHGRMVHTGADGSCGVLCSNGAGDTGFCSCQRFDLRELRVDSEGVHRWGLPKPFKVDCEVCGGHGGSSLGSGQTEPCDACDGSGRVNVVRT